jgi:exodeoxyribonuclease-3
VALQEANSRSNAEKLAHDLGMSLTFGEANSDFHAAWLSRFQVVRAQAYRPPVLQKVLLEIEINWEGAPLALFTTHLSAGRDRAGHERRLQEIHAVLDILRPIQGRPHLLVGDFNAIAPSDPVGPGRNIIKDDSSEDTAFSREVIGLILEAGYTDCYRTMHPDAVHQPGYTYKLPNPWLRLDYIFASPEMAPRLYASEVIESEEAYKASDHLPIWAEFS